MPERARFHARQLKYRITVNTPHVHLYPLIDILVEPNKNFEECRGCTTFSGYTLADNRWLNEWEEDDRRFFLNWIREESQVRVIEQARARILAEKSLPREELHGYPQNLYSQLRRYIEELPLQRASVAQWRRTLLNMKRKGIRREELDWSGLPEYLSVLAPTYIVTKEGILAAIDFSHIQPRLSNELDYDDDCHLPFAEIVQRVPNFQLQMAGYQVDDGDIGVVRYRCNSPSYRVGCVRPQGRTLINDESQRWFVLGPYGKQICDSETAVVLFNSKDVAMQVADKHARKCHRLRPKLSYSKDYEYMSLHGGDLYREWLVTLPEYHRSHFTAHYPERNVLLHIRTKIRKSDGGSQVLFIEELQSDWQQAVARDGLQSGIPLAPFRKDWISLALKLMVMHAVKCDLDGIAWADAAVHEMRYDRSMSTLQRIYDHEIPHILNRLGKAWKTKVERASFETRSPWLHAARCNECWKVEGGAGKFSTRPRYEKDQALALIERHSKQLTLSLPILRLPEAMKRDINKQGLPIFGEHIQIIPNEG